LPNIEEKKFKHNDTKKKASLKQRKEGKKERGDKGSNIDLEG